MKNIFSGGFIALFCLLLLAPVFSMVVGISPHPVAIFENRPIETAVNFKETPFVELPNKIEAYISDHVGFRSQMIAGYMRIWEEGLGSHVRFFLKGINGEYFPDFNEAPVVQRYLGFTPLPDNMVDDFRAASAGTQAFWEMHGAMYISAMVPDKTSLYKESLPPMLGELATKSIGQQIDEKLLDTPLHYIDFSNALLPYKSETPLYNKKYDILHWNGYGLEAAYKLLCAELSNTMLKCEAKPRGEHYTIVQKDMSLGFFGSETIPWMRILHPEDLQVVPNEFVPIIGPITWMKPDLIRNTKVTKGKLLFLTDSYFKMTHQDQVAGASGNVFPLAHHVQSYLHMYYGHLNLAVMEKVLQEFKPDVVVSIFAERAAGWPVNFDNPYLLLLGEAYLKSPGFLLIPGQAFGQLIKYSNCELKIHNDHVVLAAPHNDPQVYLVPIKPDSFGRVVVLAKLFSPADTVAQLFYAQGSQVFSEERSVKQKIYKGENYIRLSAYGRSGEVMNLRFDPGALSGEFLLLPIPEIHNN